jgi:hypothetical protein
MRHGLPFSTDVQRALCARCSALIACCLILVSHHRCEGIELAMNEDQGIRAAREDGTYQAVITRYSRIGLTCCL